ncbi:hypothetical protein ACFYTC_23465 [Actinomadura nitritigenes]|uniref:hypothetical protein n=1 Tax=Actinomadura nitritigenes TaxID=134602 RepID=UPI0036BA86AA
MDATEVTLDVENAAQPGDLVLLHEPAGVVPFAHGSGAPRLLEGSGTLERAADLAVRWSGRYLPQPADVS